MVDGGSWFLSEGEYTVIIIKDVSGDAFYQSIACDPITYSSTLPTAKEAKSTFSYGSNYFGYYGAYFKK